MTILRTNFESVGLFNEKFGLGRQDEGSIPSLLGDELFLFRCQFLLEELHELISSHRSGDLPGIADALADLVYVALGTAHLCRIPFDEVFEEVQRARKSVV